MDIITLPFTLGHKIVNDIARNIYQQIVWEYIMYSIKVGIIAGIAMAIAAIIIKLLKLSPLDLTTYTGCMLTGTNKGVPPFIVGSLVHIIASGAFGVGYLYLIHTFKIPGTLMYAVAMGIAHTFFSGALMLILDAINPCTRNQMVPYVGFMGTAQGLSSALTYAVIHIIYAVIVVTMLTR
jgi:hypothetical protein